jgi:DNA-binding HxlR family transcriptional regulator
MQTRKNALFCPIVKASEVIEPRWTLLILSEMGCGSTRFNDIRRGVPGISPTLLSKRLKQLEARGLVERIEDLAAGTVDYLRTDAGRELEPILEALGQWAYRHTDSEEQLCWLDPKFFMWNLRRAVDADALPRRRIVFQFSFPDWESEPRDFWIIVRPGEPVDVCFLDPGFEVDLLVRADLRALVAVYFGRAGLEKEIRAGHIRLMGSRALASSINDWLVLSSYAK